jgi:hypothetical protein
MELYSGAKMVNEKYLKTKNVRSKIEFTIYHKTKYQHTALSHRLYFLLP